LGVIDPDNQQSRAKQLNLRRLRARSGNGDGPLAPRFFHHKSFCRKLCKEISLSQQSCDINHFRQLVTSRPGNGEGLRNSRVAPAEGDESK
jgi:hypothetical protein